MAAPPDVAGVLLVDKPTGPTSFDVVRQVKRLVGVKSAGHTGTLDPLASGLLVICTGDATRIASFLTDGRKEYEGVVRFGTTTDTLDAQGTVLETRDATGLSREAVEAALATFLGKQLQIAPMYSARKHEGKRLYELARAGEEVERAPTEIEIDAIDLLDWTPPEATVRVKCSKGTYIRTLAADLGAKLGTGAHLRALRRLASGALHVREAATLQALEEAAATGGRPALLARMLSVETALVELPALQLDERRAFSVGFGNALDAAAHMALGLPLHPVGTRLRLLGPEGLVVAVGEVTAPSHVRLLRVLRPLTGPGLYKGP